VSRALKITIGILAVLVVFAVVTLPSLRQAVERLGKTPRTEEQARREVMQPPISTPTDVKVKAGLYWISAKSSASLEASTVELPLSSDPVERSKQLLTALIADAPAPERRTLPADATLLAFYLQPDGTAIADFSDELSTETPSGILGEEMAVDSIVQTLGANVNGIRRLKILIHGQEADTLAGHLDLSGFFPVSSAGSGSTPATPVPPAPATKRSKPPASIPTALGPRTKVPR
jgi:Sporulation and spore germination